MLDGASTRRMPALANTARSAKLGDGPSTTALAASASVTSRTSGSVQIRVKLGRESIDRRLAEVGEDEIHAAGISIRAPPLRRCHRSRR